MLHKDGSEGESDRAGEIGGYPGRSADLEQMKKSKSRLEI